MLLQMATQNICFHLNSTFKSRTYLHHGPVQAVGHWVCCLCKILTTAEPCQQAFTSFESLKRLLLNVKLDCVDSLGGGGGGGETILQEANPSIVFQ